MKTVVSSKGQVVIPVSIRKKLGLRPGTELEISTRGRELILSGTEPAFEKWIRSRAKRGPLKEPLKIDRSASMPPALKL